MRNKRAASAALALLFSGCSLISQGTWQKVEISSEPAGASFKVAGQEHHTPKTLNLPKEEVLLTFSMPGYDEATYQLRLRTSSYFYWSLVLGFITAGVDLFSGAWREFDSDKIHVQLQPKPGTSVEREVQVKSVPEGASVEVDGVSYGRTNARFKLRWPPTPGEKQVVLRLEGYEDLRLPLRRESPSIDARLVPKPVTVVVKLDSTPPGAEVRVDGKLVGQTPMTEKFGWGPETPAKQVEFQLKGYVPERKQLTRDASLVVAQLKEAIETVPVRIESVPPGATVEIDGGRAGVTPIEVPLDWSAGKLTHHTLKFFRAGYHSEEFRVERDRKDAPVTVRLRPLLPRYP
jgi:hypothetical protein